jgi:hypothetical protein
VFKKIAGSTPFLIGGILLAAYGGVKFVELAVLPRLSGFVGGGASSVSSDG